MDIKHIKEKVAALPPQPGVYIMKNDKGAIIYVGKAKNLKNRVSSYFVSIERHTPKVASMVRVVDDFEIIVAGSEFEALVLENILIKEHQPKYNIKLKDDKGYPFIRVDLSEEYPSFSVVAKKLGDKARYFGPYGGHGIARNALDTISRALKMPTCRRKFPADIGKSRPCLNAHMGRCVAVCAGGVSKEEYRAMVEQAMLLLDGRYEQLTRSLREQMDRYAEALEFEKAAALRDRIGLVETLGNKQKIITEHIGDADAVAFFAGDTMGAVVLLGMRGGMLMGKVTTFVERAVEEDANEILTDFLLQYYSERETIPDAIFLSEEIEDGDVLASLFGNQSGHKVEIKTPKRGEKHALVDMARFNARDEVERAEQHAVKSSKSASECAELCGLDKPPARIEAFDISNTGNSDIVGSMVVFEEGKPLKRAYRKFKIKGKSSQDDYFSMHEVLFRRLTALAEGREGFQSPPDMLLIDGGKGHLSAAHEAAVEAGVLLPMFGMVKDDRHRTRALVTLEGEEIGLTSHPAVFALIGRIQEEAHRFAIEFHRDLRDKKKIRSALDDIEGIGETRRKALLQTFKSVAGVKKADVESLARVVPMKLAQKIYRTFHEGEEA